MDSLSFYAYMASLVALTGAGLMSLAQALPAPTSALKRALPESGTGLDSRNTIHSRSGSWSALLATYALTLLTGALALRWLTAGHAPFSSMYEFSLSFVWASLAVYLYVQFKYKVPSLALLIIPLCLALLAYAATLPSEVAPLVPALQNQLLLTAHVAVAVAAYGAFAVSFAAAVLFLVNRHNSFSRLPSRAVLDAVSYRSVAFGFPLMALVIILGAVWAHIAWGAYWNWDPKETASLLTWLIYGGYLHARVIRGWQGDRSAYLLVLGFVAVMFTYFGNYFLGGLHGYA